MKSNSRECEPWSNRGFSVDRYRCAADLGAGGTTKPVWRKRNFYEIGLAIWLVAVSPCCWLNAQDFSVIDPRYTASSKFSSQRQPNQRTADFEYPAPSSPLGAGQSNGHWSPFQAAESSTFLLGSRVDGLEESKLDRQIRAMVLDSEGGSQQRDSIPRLAMNQAAVQEKPSQNSPGTPSLADEPELGADFFPHHNIASSSEAHEVPYSADDFCPDPNPYTPFDPFAEVDVFQGKYLNPTQRPLLELGRPFYQRGQLPESSTILGRTNLMHPQFMIFGDLRMGVGVNGVDGDFSGNWSAVLNLEMDLRLTATERFHARVAPLDRNGQATGIEFDVGETRFINNTDLEFDTGFFEGDLGAITGGLVDEVLPFDLPFTVGAIPLLFQNGIWMDDAFIGLAVALPARNSPMLHISNYDAVFFWGWDNITSPAFEGDDNAAKMYGTQFFLEMFDGYIETGYVYLEDRNRVVDRSYHNMAFAFTRRYGQALSNSVRVIANAGQSRVPGGETADGVLLLMENSLITRNPSRVVPYFNLFAGFGRPQSVARAGNAGGILRNTGINFETDGVTRFPTLDDTANDSWGGALGINLLAPEFSQQIVLETAFVDVFGTDPDRNAKGSQLGFGIRYQLPISNAVIFRADAMHGLRRNEEDLTGFRVEFRHKF